MRTSIDVPEDLRDILEHRAKRNCRSLSGEIVYMLRSYLRQESRVEVDIFRAITSDPRAD